MDYVHMKTYKIDPQNASLFHPEVGERISEVERSNKESLLAGRGVFDKVFERPTSGDDRGTRKGAFLFSFTQSGYQTEYITVLNQDSVALKIKCRPPNIRKEFSKQFQLFDCSECDFNCWWDYIMIRHVRKTHSKGNLYVCAYCKFYCVQKYFYDLHVLENHRNSLAVYPCDMCDFVASKKGVLKQHMGKHRDEKVLHSHVRGFGTMTQNLLNKQKQIHRTEKPFACSVCDYQTRNKGHLKTHEMIHTGEKPFSCTYCEYESRHKGNIKGHIREHHMPTQTTEKPFLCSFCDYRTRNKGHLKSHELIHTDEKPFICTFCDYQCRQKCHLKDHIRRMHKPTQNR